MMHVIKFKRSSERIIYEQNDKIIESTAFLPSTAFVSLTQESGVSLEPIVSSGDYVKEAQLIARSKDKYTTHVYAPIPGIIEKFDDFPLPHGKKGKVALIKLQGSFSLLGKKEENHPWEHISETEILRIFEEKGTLNTFDNAVPLVTTVREAKKNEIPEVVIRLFNDDPTCTLDSFLFKNKQDKIFEGISIIAKSAGAKKIYFLYVEKQFEKNSFDSYSNLFSQYEIIFKKCNSKYPNGFKTQLVDFLGFTKTKNKIFIDPHTALSAYEAIVNNRPMLQKYVLFTGPSLIMPSILKCRIGTPIGELIEECGGFKRNPVGIVVNGLLTGNAINDLDTPISNTTKSVHVLDKDICPNYTVQDCIHCGLCFAVCPKYIDPSKTVHAILSNNLTKKNRSDIQKCQFCGCCMMVCSARIPLHHIIKEALQEIT